MTPEQEAEILAYFQGGNPPENFPHQGEVFEAVRKSCQKKIRSRTDLKDLADHLIEDVCDRLSMNAWTALLNGELLESGYDPQGGLSLVGWFSRFAPERALDAVNAEKRRRTAERRSYHSGGSIGSSFEDTLRQIIFYVKKRNRLVQPLKTLGLQLGKSLDWDPAPQLREEFQTEVSSMSAWPSLLQQRIEEGKKPIAEALANWNTSAAHLETLEPDQSLQADQISNSSLENWRKQRFVVERRKRRYQKLCIEGCWFPLKSDDLVDLLEIALGNAQQLRSRSRRQIFDLLTTGTSEHDQGLLIRFFSDTGVEETEDPIQDVDKLVQGDDSHEEVE